MKSLKNVKTLILYPLVVLLCFQNLFAEQTVALRGWSEFKGRVWFSLQHMTEPLGSKWVAVGQPVFGGRVIGFKQEGHSILFERNGVQEWITISSHGSFVSELDLETPVNNQSVSSPESLKPFEDAPKALIKLPPIERVEFLVDGGYEVPHQLKIRAESARIEQAIKKSAHPEKSWAHTAGQEKWLPRAPRVTTSMTREEKIARGIFGYTNSND